MATSKTDSASDKVFEQKKDETWSQTIKKGDMTESIRVEKLDNKGYLIILEKYGYEKNDKKHEKYVNSSKKLYSDVNPLDSDETDNPIMKVADMITRNK